ncbi:MAG: ankyrin repeat domain-containing protein, partial [Rickettsiaceae bacterium]|nr:ankyrin repeat domain-containing protein [Rickettsiaceae bacterium]
MSKNQHSENMNKALIINACTKYITDELEAKKYHELFIPGGLILPTVLRKACIDDDVALALAILDKYKNIQGNIYTPDTFGRTALSYACEHSPKIAKLLLEKGAKFNTPDKAGRTPLSHACEHSPEIAKLLLDKGAEFNTPDKTGRAPLSYACEHSPEIAKLLLDKGAEFNTPDNLGITPLSRACYKGYEEIAVMLSAKGAEINTPHQFAITPLSYACMSFSEEGIMHLIHNKEYNASDLLVDVCANNKLGIARFL